MLHWPQVPREAVAESFLPWSWVLCFKCSVCFHRFRWYLGLETWYRCTGGVMSWASRPERSKECICACVFLGCKKNLHIWYVSWLIHIYRSITTLVLVGISNRRLSRTPPWTCMDPCRKGYKNRTAMAMACLVLLSKPKCQLLVQHLPDLKLETFCRCPSWRPSTFSFAPGGSEIATSGCAVRTSPLSFCVLPTLFQKGNKPSRRNAQNHRCWISNGFEWRFGAPSPRRSVQEAIQNMEEKVASAIDNVRQDVGKQSWPWNHHMDTVCISCLCVDAHCVYRII